ncbi:hypothetical protein F3Y22_tig00110569pilonHSYRG00318 [Hibiscus syriacus]|uniref:Uncharacterized protein n=1 Tax=Hibiscus syriacus TaxID=106335 RepID=A0A6A3A792_HIBSY|nr:hypothetical protein F3Y22_tig00110569pilonHSYRG00318 [Hibiscus syriacus]
MRVAGSISVPLLFLMAMLLIFNSKCCGAAVLVEKNETSSGCSGQIDDGYGSGFIGDGVGLEVLTDSYVHRVLQSGNGRSKTAFTNNPKGTMSCGGGRRPYVSCLGDKKPANTAVHSIVSAGKGNMT